MTLPAMTDPHQTAAALSEAQKRALIAVCRTNGGGVPVRCRRDPETGYGIPHNGAYRKLLERGLIQGKAGGYETVVHTRDGLALYRAILEQRHD